MIVALDPKVVADWPFCFSTTHLPEGDAQGTCADTLGNGLGTDALRKPLK